MRYKLRIILFGAFLLSALVVFSSLLALPVSAASFSSAQTSTVSKSADLNTIVLPQSQRDYNRGFRDGWFAADRVCSRFRVHHMFHRRRESDYQRGFVDGFNFALDHDRFCRHR